MRHIFALLLIIICLTSCNTGKPKQNNEKPVIAVTSRNVISPKPLPEINSMSSASYPKAAVRKPTIRRPNSSFHLETAKPISASAILASNKSGWIVSQTIPHTFKYSIRRKM